MEPAGVRVEQVTKRFGSLLAVQDLSLEVAPGEFFSLLGPSGCGKTTLLRIIGGFEQPDGGRVFIGKEEVTALPPQKRPTAMVFQQYALFPHMTVGENVAYGLRIRGIPSGERQRHVCDVLAKMGLAGMEERPVTQLSGGQQQRVALARALAVSPRVILFDEPLSNLDVALREQTRRELKALQHELGMTAIYVTHDQQEALALSDRLGVMRAGQLVEVGNPQDLYYRPRTAYVAQFLGGSNVLTEQALIRRIVSERAIPAGKVAAVRPEHWRRVTEGTAHALKAKVLTVQFLGPFTEWWVDVEGKRLRVWMPVSEEPADEVYLQPTRVHWVEKEV